MVLNKQKVKEFGEVFTPDSIVCDMLELVNNELKDKSYEEYISTTYLEPSCGDGQFLIRILAQKMERIPKDATVEEKKLLLVKALCSIYGVDIQEEHVESARNRMLDVALGKPVETFDLNDKDNVIQIDLGIEMDYRYKRVLNNILANNIIQGNTLADDACFNEYEFDGMKVTIRQYRIADMKAGINKPIGDPDKYRSYMSIPIIENKAEEEDTDFF